MVAGFCPTWTRAGGRAGVPGGGAAGGGSACDSPPLPLLGSGGSGDGSSGGSGGGFGVVPGLGPVLVDYGGPEGRCLA